MKSIAILIAVTLFVNGANAQEQKEKSIKESEVPAAVKGAFASKFSSVKKVKWAMESANEFEAEFKSSLGSQSANFDLNGTWLGTETEISEKTLPAAVQQTIKKEFAGYEIEESEKVETPDRGSFFEVELEQGEKTIVAEISAEGKVLKTETKEE